MDYILRNQTKILSDFPASFPIPFFRIFPSPENQSCDFFHICLLPLKMQFIEDLLTAYYHQKKDHKMLNSNMKLQHQQQVQLVETKCFFVSDTLGKPKKTKQQVL